MTLRRELIWGGLWGDQLDGVRAPKRHTELRRTNEETAAAIIVKNHYSRSRPFLHKTVNFIVLWHGEIHGAIMLGLGHTPTGNGSLDGWRIEFDRMWLSDDMPKYSETCVIGLLHTWLRKARPEIRVIASWSDTSEGNFGTIYKAANYRYVKATPCPFYRLPCGRKIHGTSLFHLHGTRRDSMLRLRYPGIQKIEGDQLLFEYEL